MVEDVGNIVAFRYLYTDVSSIAMETCHNANTTCRQSAHLAFGAPRELPVASPKSRSPTTVSPAKKEDATGLYYFNARYYDPEIGQVHLAGYDCAGPLRVDATIVTFTLWWGIR
ncbi:MAG: hypothetical protein M9896_19835 [Candidatus Promineofilum sp.]|uniref:hypothetical protein n=1 Tax=Promineifilum sp. TaxID=2664178 RepID=UPI002411C2F3|nr:hypothetical protein [Promineifilum sp.]